MSSQIYVEDSVAANRRWHEILKANQDEANRHLEDTVELPEINQTVLLGPNAVVLEAEGYSCLAQVMERAFDQASAGKGAERHAQALPFDEQPMQKICQLVGPGFALGQAMKKIQESQRLTHDRAIAELLGAINYIAGAVIHLEKNRDE